MSKELPPPPSYQSLYSHGEAGPSHPAPSAPPIEPGTPQAQHSGTSGKSRSLGKQASLESPYPPSHPYYPGPQTLPAFTTEDPGRPLDGEGGATGYQQSPHHYPGGNPPGHGSYPPGGTAASFAGGPPPDVYPPSQPGGQHPPAAIMGYPPPGPYPDPAVAGAAWGHPPRGPEYPPPPGPDGAYPTDPLLNPPYPSQPPPAGNAFGDPYPSPQRSRTPQPAAVTAPESVEVALEGPLVDVDDNGNPVNPNAPTSCELRHLEDFPNISGLLAEGQRDHIDQLQEDETPALFKWCCVAFWSLGAHLCFFICLILLVVQVPKKDAYDSWRAQASSRERRLHIGEPDYNSTTLICASVFLVVCWLVAVIEAWVSDTESYVSNAMILSDFRAEHRKLRQSVPVIVWEGEAYHHGKERIVWENNRMVSRRRSSDTHRAVTYKETIAFPFSKCIDASGDLDTFKRGVINRFEFEKTFGFMDEVTANTYKQQKEAFIARIKPKDTEFSFSERFVMPDMKERMTVYMEEGCRTSLISGTCYNVLTCFLLTWPYRIFFRCITRKRKYTFVKLVGL